MPRQRKKRRTFEIAKAWAWDFPSSNGCTRFLCRWAEPIKAGLELTQKPADDAKPVAVYIIRRKDFDAQHRTRRDWK